MKTHAAASPYSALLFTLSVFCYMVFGTPTNPLNETLTLVSKYASTSAQLFYGTAYLGILSLSAGAILLLALTRSKTALAVFVLLATTHCFDFIYQAVTKTRFSVSDYIYLSKEITNAGLAIQEYGTLVGASCLVLTLAITVVLWCRKRYSISPRYGLHWIGLSAALLAVLFSLYSSEGKRDNYVSAIRLPAIVLYTTLFPEHSGMSIAYQPRKLSEDVLPVQPPAGKHLLVILDESVSSQYLSLNGYSHSTTPYLESIADILVNLNTVVSVSNLSMNSNYILRNGLTPAQLPDVNGVSLAQPSLFTYAKRAGMHTVLIDAQQQVPAMQNYLSKYDLEDIDEYIYFPATDKRFDNDFTALNRLLEIQKQHDSTFIFLVKYGAHFPYEERYPPESAIFFPDLLVQKPSEVNAGRRESALARRSFVNSYLNALRWNVDMFFAELIPQLPPHTLLLYTSDHGQSLLDPTIIANHGISHNPPAAQVTVPLFLLGTIFQPLFGSATPNQPYSQFQLFPSILQLLGYSEDITRPYGPTLWQGTLPQTTFSGNIFKKSGVVTPIAPQQAKIALPDGEFAQERRQ